MRPTPYQTYLEERLQSAKGLGWDFEATGKAGVGAGVGWARFASALRPTLPNLRRWFRFAR